MSETFLPSVNFLDSLSYQRYTLYEFPDHVIPVDGFSFIPPEDLNGKIDDVVLNILYEKNIGNGICWMWAIAASGSCLMDTEFNPMFYKVAKSLSELSLDNVLKLNPLLKHKKRLPIINEGIDGIASSNGGLNMELLDPKFAHQTTDFINMILRDNNLQLRLSPMEVASKQIRYRTSHEVENFIVDLVMNSIFKKKIPLFTMQLQTINPNGNIHIVTHMVASTGFYKDMENILYMGILDINEGNIALIPTHKIGEFFNGLNAYVYRDNIYAFFVNYNPFILLSRDK